MKDMHPKEHLQKLQDCLPPWWPHPFKDYETPENKKKFANLKIDWSRW